jgi:UPF0755 protein
LTKEKQKQKRKKVRFFSVLLNTLTLFVSFALVLIPVGLGIIMLFNSPVHGEKPIILTDNDAIKRENDGSYLIEVRRGETSQSVGLRLERTGLITNRYIWNILCRLDSEHIKTGTYRLELPATMLSIHRLLISGREILTKVTIPEGVTLSKTARILEDAGVCSASSFLSAARNHGLISEFGIINQSMEGYLFPDTYLFPSDYPAELVVRKMANNFFEKLENISPSYKSLNTKELNDKVILASIVEREYRVVQEAPLMAGVFLNRLRIGMALQSCATVEYVITEILGRPHPNVLLYADLEIQNRYNTYLYRGLPPGPISAPGVVALRAVMYPETTNYLYFRLVDVSSGRHYFSRTHDEHIRAGQLFTKPTWP